MFATASRRPTWSKMRALGWEPDDIIDSWGIVRPPVPVERIVVEAGIDLRFFHADRNYSGALDARGERPVIWVNAAEAHVRQRFTVAHELGHLLLHADVKMFRDVYYADFNPQEAEANRFAAELLMPETMVTGAIRVVGYDPRRLASLFVVSTKAMEYRLKNLGMP